MTELKWPEKKDDSIGNEFEPAYYENGWNACHNAFMKVIEAHPSGLVPLDRDKLYKVMKSVQAFEGDEFHESLEKILETFGTKEREVPTVQELINIGREAELKELRTSYNWKLIRIVCEAIHARLKSNQRTFKMNVKGIVEYKLSGGIK